jgi:hypothetical protein
MYDEYAKRYIRISYLAPETELAEALRRFAALYRACAKRGNSSAAAGESA